MTQIKAFVRKDWSGCPFCGSPTRHKNNCPRNNKRIKEKADELGVSRHRAFEILVSEFHESLLKETKE